MSDQFIKPTTTESIPILEVKNLECTLKPQDHTTIISTVFRDMRLNSEDKWEREFREALPELIEKRNLIRLEREHKDNFLYASEPFGWFVGDCTSCHYYQDCNTGLSEGGDCFCNERGAPKTCGHGFTCPYNTSEYNKGWKEFERIQAETIGAPSRLPKEYQDQLMSRFCRKD